ncbi:DEAD/DEAH box helicase [Aureimonas pseudogalii]|uniref:Transcription-repair-coupling factor n=1 Tax=Aureimonas pseudogalii TaxID=1744844 RepID=A0A7W6EF52_9HYPH|nr:DEAD/DEAH box helicase [Aureimonas pseudogalii]MBB3998262.1 transcription-repair coupling factor (superfamily II helicase) [Aureimonas pseudogalii]
MLQSVTLESQSLSAEKLAPLHPIGASAAVIHRQAARERGRTLVYVAQTARRARDIMAVLSAFDPERPLAYLPPWDCLPYDGCSPSRSVMGQRMGVLRWLTNAENRPAIVVTTAEALLRRVPPRAIWTDLHREFRVGDAIDVTEVEAHLRRIGYVFDDRVDEPGEAAIRGRVIDFFPAAASSPCRVEHHDGIVVAIRSYDAASQRTISECEMLIVDPASEIPGSAPTDLGAAVGREHALSTHYDALDTVFDYLGDAAILIEDGVARRAQAFLEGIDEAHREAPRSGGRRAVAPHRMFLEPREWETAVAAHLGAVVDDDPHASADFFVPRFAEDRAPWGSLAAFLDGEPAGQSFVLAAPTKALLDDWVRRARRQLGRKIELGTGWDAILAAEGGGFGLVLPIAEGFRVPDAGVVVVAVQDLAGQTAGAVRATTEATPFAVADATFSIGDAVVHIDHGVGILEGLDRLEHGKAHRDVIRMRYADDGRLMVPVEEIGALWRYSGGDGGVTLDKLKGGNWVERRNAILQRVRGTAERITERMTQRHAARCKPVKLDRRRYERFCARFPYELSPDQAKAVDDVLSDLTSGRPMNRLVCGDVGFGKTEVALRAAAAVAFSGRQVAIVAPTTVLAQQHARSFAKRFAGFGLEVAYLSRQSGAKEAQQIRERLRSGEIQIVVGTHSLCGKGIAFDDLGLVAIDEEQRFGAAQKTALRNLVEGAHSLTLTATPIPQTLQASFVGLNELSVIATPPVLRQPIQTVLSEFDGDLVKEALERERRRGGQSFVVCPRVEDIQPMADRLRALVPELDVAIVHGQLAADEVDETMLRFTEGDGDILLATNIIESGLDVPAANTMIVWRPDRFGLAQLHQLRGRVGRGSRRGVAYLMTEKDVRLPPETERRLRTLEAMNRLGAGFQISARDLDLRGAGDLLGEEQAGHLQLVGLTLYRHFLTRALLVAEGKPVPDDWVPEIALGVAGRIPQAYVPDDETRINLYAEIDHVRDRASLDMLKLDIVDRFGALPRAAKVLLKLAELRIRCFELGIQKLAAGPKGIAATFRTNEGAKAATRRPVPTDWRWCDRKLVYPIETKGTAERLNAAVTLLNRVDGAS